MFSWTKIKTYLAALVMIFIALGFPFFVKYIVLMKTQFRVAQSNDWIGFYGSYMGGLATLLGIWLTLGYYRNKDLEDGRRESDKTKLSIRPYFKVTNVTDFQNVEYHTVQFKSAEPYDIMKDVSCKFEIQNVGLGTAVDITFTRLYTYEKTVLAPTLTIQVGAKDYIEVTANGNISNFSGNTFLTVNYADLMGNRYEQDIIIKVNTVANLGTNSLKVDGTLYPKPL